MIPLPALHALIEKAKSNAAREKMYGGSRPVEIDCDDAVLIVEELIQARGELEQLRRGEFICRKCGLRKDSEPCDTGGHF